MSMDAVFLDIENAFDTTWHTGATRFRPVPSQSQSHVTTDGQSVSMSWCKFQSGTCDQIVFSV
jgi:hypothetical protein